jgi:hypothetical protein
VRIAHLRSADRSRRRGWRLHRGRAERVPAAVSETGAAAIGFRRRETDIAKQGPPAATFRLAAGGRGTDAGDMLANIHLGTAIHVLAAFGVFAALGAICLGGSEKSRKAALGLHGFSLLVLLGAGLYQLVVLELVKSGGWWHTKILLWLVLGIAPVLSRRKILPPAAILGICFAIGAVATYLGLAKSFSF